MNEYIEVGQSLQFTDPNTPTRVGEIVENVSDIYNIPSPRLGMQVFVKSEKKSFVITSLKSKVIGGVDVPEAAVEAFEPVGAKSITWNNDNDPSNMNDFTIAGVYDIKGERKRTDDNLPILNTGGGHSFNARLTVLDSSISGSGNDDDKCITQVLSFSNRLGQGEVYIRTGKGSSLDNLTWENWSTLQRNVNVGKVGSLDDLKDNGIYSGVWLFGSLNNHPLTFVCVVINDYFIGTAPRRVSQFVYGLSKFDGSVVYQSRVWDDSKDKWSDWEILNKNEINSMIDNAIKGIIADAPEAFDTLREIADWIADDETGAVALANAISANIKAINEEIARSAATDLDLLRSIDDEARRATEAEEEIRSLAIDGSRIYSSSEDKSIAINYSTIGGGGGSVTIPAATTTAAGVMSAEDKEKLDTYAINTGNVVEHFHIIVGTHPYGRFFLKKNYNYRFVFEETGYTSPLYKTLINNKDSATLVKSTTGGEFLYKPTEDVEAYLSLYSGSEGEVTVTVTSLPVLQKEIADNLSFEAMPVLPAVVKSKYTKYDDGVPTGSGSYFTQYVYGVAAFVGRTVKVNSYSSDSVPAVVAFYSSGAISADTYLKGASVQATGGYDVVDVVIPEGAVTMVVTHRNVDDFTRPVVLMKGLVEEPLGINVEAVSLGKNSTGIYVKYEDGSLVSTGNHWKYSKVVVKGLRDIIVECGALYDKVAAPIAFYTVDGVYIKEYSVQGQKGTNLKFSALVPDNAEYAICCAATSLKVMTHSIGAVVENIPQIYIDPLKAFVNPFVGKPFYHHLNQEQVSAIPAQSLYDIAYAKALGFSVIEANVHKCADGVYVTKHGSNGKLGAGLVFAEGCGITADTAFGSVTSADLRAYVTYDTPLPQYAGHIPTLDEFCAESKRLGMKILLQVIDDEVLNIARTYFADSDIIAYGIKSRGDFKGLITTFQHVADTTTVESVLSVCESFGKPYMFGGFWSSSMSDDKVKEITNALHSNGYLAGAAYAEALVVRRLAGLGVDVFASMADVNLFDAGNVNNVFSFDNFDVVSGAVTIENGVANMSQNGVLRLTNEAFENNHGKVLVSLLFDGELNVEFGNIKTYTVASDGTEWITMARVIGRSDRVIALTALTDTVIKGVKVLSSVVI